MWHKGQRLMSRLRSCPNDICMTLQTSSLATATAAAIRWLSPESVFWHPTDDTPGWSSLENRGSMGLLLDGLRPTCTTFIARILHQKAFMGVRTFSDVLDYACLGGYSNFTRPILLWTRLLSTFPSSSLIDVGLLTFGDKFSEKKSGNLYVENLAIWR